MYSSSSDQVESSAAHISPSSLPHEEGSLQKCLDLERCSLWRCLVRAAVPAAMQKKKAIMRHGMVHAVFSALDGQYRYGATDGATGRGNGRTLLPLLLLLPFSC